ncbi:MAG: hypothetical protein D6698_12775 [Gammaproteobacteria bacterium]|nr:MAG: hypothetical protein D6698_12775 [Gammaproteobacteria bacterium]
MRLIISLSILFVVCLSDTWASEFASASRVEDVAGQSNPVVRDGVSASDHSSGKTASNSGQAVITEIAVSDSGSQAGEKNTLLVWVVGSVTFLAFMGFLFLILKERIRAFRRFMGLFSGSGGLPVVKSLCSRAIKKLSVKNILKPGDRRYHASENQPAKTVIKPLPRVRDIPNVGENDAVGSPASEQDAMVDSSEEYRHTRRNRRTNPLKPLRQGPSSSLKTFQDRLQYSRESKLMKNDAPQTPDDKLRSLEASLRDQEKKVREIMRKRQQRERAYHHAKKQKIEGSQRDINRFIERHQEETRDHNDRIDVKLQLMEKKLQGLKSKQRVQKQREALLARLERYQSELTVKEAAIRLQRNKLSNPLMSTPANDQNFQQSRIEEENLQKLSSQIEAKKAQFEDLYEELCQDDLFSSSSPEQAAKIYANWQEELDDMMEQIRSHRIG